MTPVEDMKLMHWGKSKINLGLGKRKNSHIQTGLMGTGLCLGLCLLLIQRDTACTSFQVGTQWVWG